MTRLLAFVFLCLAAPVWAAVGESVVRESATVRLISAENGVTPEAQTLNVGIDVTLSPGWKTYWRSPGEVGLPPEIAWDGARNIETAELLFPAPERFTAFDIENFGYGERVIFPLQVMLEHPGAPVSLAAQVQLLVCSDVCIPETFDLRLDLEPGDGIDRDSAALLADAVRDVPIDMGDGGVKTLTAHLDQSYLTVAVAREHAFLRADVFPELGRAEDMASFGKPDIRLSDGGRHLWARFPVHYAPDGSSHVDITLTDGPWAVTGAATMLAAAPAAPLSTGILWMAGLALLGGLLLNIMPCVLPVLSLKIGHAVEHAGHGPGRVRAGFLASAAGILAFMWALAASVLALQAMGAAVGWGIQFQNPAFLSVMVLLMVLFAANMAGLYEINLPAWAQSRLGHAGRDGLVGDFATGAFAAVMATPCSAPFVGTAVAFALSGGALDVGVIFTALGLGLALPYLLFAMRPRLIVRLPKPGPWMVHFKWLLAGLLGLSALWLLSVLWAAAGTFTALFVAAVSVALLALFLRPFRGRAALSGLALIAALMVPALLATPSTASRPASDWAALDQALIDRETAAGRVVFVDVTADWCLTCKANKALVLDRAPVSTWLTGEDVLAMQGDWTRPDAEIQTYLRSFDRFGIPFNAVYGPNAPQGIALPELLTAKSIQDALERAR